MEDILTAVETIEYVTFNRMPAEPPEEKYMKYFTEPLRVFGDGPNAQRWAETWANEINKIRWEERNSNGRGLEIDNMAGELVSVVVKCRRVIKYPYQEVE